MQHFQLLPCTKWGNYRLKLSLSAYYKRKLRTFNTSNAPINVKPLGGGRPGKGGGFDCNHRPVVGFFDRFNDLSSNILLTFGCYFDNPQCPGVGHLNGNSQLSSNAPPMPGLPPPQRLNIDRCIIG